jgi:serine protease Do
MGQQIAHRRLPRSLPAWIALLLCGQPLVDLLPARANELRRTAIVRAVEEAIPSVVNIHGEKLEDGTDPTKRVNGMGTGIVIDEQGYIVTNYHVVEGVERIQVSTHRGETVIGRLVAHDPRTDLAIVKINLSQPLPTIRVGTSSDLMLGEPVIAIGNAYGYPHTITRGIISQLHRPVQISDEQKYTDLIQTDASINPGNSGGPLLNIEGDLIGINVAVRVGAQGIGFAVPIDQAIDVVSRLLDAELERHVQHGLVGRTINNPPECEFVITEVTEDSPANAVGIQPGDVIAAVNDQPVRRSLDFQRTLLRRSPGDEVTISLRRNNQPMSVSMKLASAETRPQTISEAAWDKFGLRLSPMTRQSFGRLNSRYRGGLKVVGVKSDGPAAKQGIRYGDVLVGMHKWETISVDNLAYILESDVIREGTPLKFYILRGTETLYGHLEPQR